MQTATFTTSKEDPWWLMQTFVENMNTLQTDHPTTATNRLTDLDRMLMSAAVYSVYSPFEPHLLTEISQCAPLLFIPNTFGSIAIYERGPNSDVTMLVPDANPPPDYSANVRNLSRPMWRENLVVVETHEQNSTVIDYADPATSQTRKKRKVANDVDATLAMDAGKATTATDKVYYKYRERWFFDHAPVMSQMRGPLLSRFAILHT